MPRPHRLSPIAALALVLVVPQRADAVLSLSLGPHIGWVYTKDSEENLFTYGGAARLSILQFLTAELAVQYQKEDTGQGDIATLPIQLSGMLNIMPFLHGTVGFGYYSVDASLEGVSSTLGSIDDTAQDAAMHIGAGVNFPLATRGTLTGELRYVFLDYSLDDVNGQPIDVDADFFQITAGVLFKLF
jgi:hypothetical protein